MAAARHSSADPVNSTAGVRRPICEFHVNPETTCTEVHNSGISNSITFTSKCGIRSDEVFGRSFYALTVNTCISIFADNSLTRITGGFRFAGTCTEVARIALRTRDRTGYTLAGIRRACVDGAQVGIVADYLRVHASTVGIA
jgi:hypothetical protein